MGCNQLYPLQNDLEPIHPLKTDHDGKTCGTHLKKTHFYEIKQNSGGKNEKGSALKCFPYSIWWCTNCFISPMLRTGHIAMKKVYLKKRLFLVLVVKFSNRSYHDQYQNWLLEGIITTVTMKTKSLIIKRYRKCLDMHTTFLFANLCFY